MAHTTSSGQLAAATLAPLWQRWVARLILLGLSGSVGVGRARRFKRQVSRDRICQTLVALNIILLITLGCVVGFRWQTLRHAIGI